MLILTNKKPRLKPKNYVEFLMINAAWSGVIPKRTLTLMSTPPSQWVLELVFTILGLVILYSCFYLLTLLSLCSTEMLVFVV